MCAPNQARPHAVSMKAIKAISTTTATMPLKIPGHNIDSYVVGCQYTTIPPLQPPLYSASKSTNTKIYVCSLCSCSGAANAVCVVA